MRNIYVDYAPRIAMHCIMYIFNFQFYTSNSFCRGHPLCEFCDMRYMDSDELFRHLRREHFYCHFCDADGKHEFYNSYDDLRNHFLEEHYLCEEGDCKNEKFTSAFRTDIDLKGELPFTLFEVCQG